MGHPPAVTPATGRQVRALQAAFADLGYTRRSDRPARLTAAATALGISRLDSFTDLTTGQAGILLRRLRSRSEPPGTSEGGESPSSTGIPHALAAVVILMWLAGALRKRGPLLAQDTYRSTTRTSPAPKNARPAS